MYSDLVGVKVGREEGRKQGNLEHTVVPNLALWNVDFQLLGIVLLDVFSSK
jgi:hypothetical protein